MKLHNSYYFTVCKISIKLLPLIISGFLFGCSEQKETKQVLPIQNQVSVSGNALNINTASAEELKKIPHVGEKLAEKIIEHRENFGRFRKAELLLLVDGISDKRFRQIRNLVKVE
jgi:competence ComEA-like helix-hairpin-helix protein